MDISVEVSERLLVILHYLIWPQDHPSRESGRFQHSEVSAPPFLAESVGDVPVWFMVGPNPEEILIDSLRLNEGDTTWLAYTKHLLRSGNEGMFESALSTFKHRATPSSGLIALDTINLKQYQPGQQEKHVFGTDPRTTVSLNSEPAHCILSNCFFSDPL